jgi:hypothetical protein
MQSIPAQAFLFMVMTKILAWGYRGAEPRFKLLGIYRFNICSLKEHVPS